MSIDTSEPSTASRLPGNARPRRFWASTLRISAAAIAGYLTVLAAAMIYEDSLIYFPLRYPEGDWKPDGLRVEDAWFNAADGTRLHGWYVPGKGERGAEKGERDAKEKAPAAVLFCHGNGGNITHRAYALMMLHDRVGASVLIFDYRGYGRSEGRPNEAGVLADARAARAWLAAREKIRESDVVLLGESLGGAVAVDLAARDGARALVLESTFDSLPNVAAHHYPFLPVRWAMRSRFDSVAKIGKYQGPLFQAHGDADTIVPLEYGRKLFEAANAPKQFLLLPGRDHNDPLPAEYYDALAKFLESL